MADVVEEIFLLVCASFQTSVLQGLPLQHFKQRSEAFVSAPSRYKCPP